MKGRSLAIAVAATISAGAAAGGGGAASTAVGLKPYGDWTYVQAMSIEEGQTRTSSAHGTLRLFKSGVFSDKRGIADFFPSYKAGKFKFVGNKIYFTAIKNGRRDPENDGVYTYVFSRKYLALSIVTKLEDGSKLAFLLYLKGSENLPRCKNLGISLKC